jgi:hypothetical protein
MHNRPEPSAAASEVCRLWWAGLPRPDPVRRSGAGDAGKQWRASRLIQTDMERGIQQQYCAVRKVPTGASAVDSRQVERAEASRHRHATQPCARPNQHGIRTNTQKPRNLNWQPQDSTGTLSRDVKNATFDNQPEPPPRDSRRSLVPEPLLTAGPPDSGRRPVVACKESASVGARLRANWSRSTNRNR